MVGGRIVMSNHAKCYVPAVLRGAGLYAVDFFSSFCVMISLGFPLGLATPLCGITNGGDEVLLLDWVTFAFLRARLELCGFFLTNDSQRQ